MSKKNGMNPTLYAKRLLKERGLHHDPTTPPAVAAQSAALHAQHVYQREVEKIPFQGDKADCRRWANRRSSVAAVVRDEILLAEYSHQLAEGAAHQAALDREEQRLLQKLDESHAAKRTARSALDSQNVKFLQLGVVPDTSRRDGRPVKKDDDAGHGSRATSSATSSRKDMTRGVSRRCVNSRSASSRSSKKGLTPST